jgi:CelD/BcsL family acetyltransferase involved in cellulose biosynthesis
MGLDGHAVAADLNFRFADREVAFMSGRDPAFRAEYVGLTLMFHTIRQAVSDGVTEFHLLRGNQPFKARLPHRVRQVDHVALSGSLAGVLAIAARTARDKLRLVRHDRRLVRPLLKGPQRPSQEGGEPGRGTGAAS